VSAPVPPPGGWPKAAIVIPTRDHAAFLARCVADLRQATDYPDFHAVIVDNGSVEPEAVALLDGLRGDPRFTVLPFPGPFNYAAMCNAGAAQAGGDVLVLLNNDVTVCDPGWLKALVAWAMRPDVGAVGAKLLYPDGRLQHAGIVIGSGGRAGHVDKDEPADAPGYLGRLASAHEVAAVTGACLAVAREKYEAVGGLDAENLPVDLNDVDLCLRLSERGWRSIWCPQAVLCHVESGSRRRSLNPASLYASERRYFVLRWRHLIRDDPWFHPALSLYSHAPALAAS
jgi:GT2 family glycosyltransferase